MWAKHFWQLTRVPSLLRTVCEVKSPPRPVWELLKEESFANIAWKAFFPILGVSWLAHLTQHFSHFETLAWEWFLKTTLHVSVVIMSWFHRPSLRGQSYFSHPQIPRWRHPRVDFLPCLYSHTLLLRKMRHKEVRWHSFSHSTHIFTHYVSRSKVGSGECSVHKIQSLYTRRQTSNYNKIGWIHYWGSGGQRGLYIVWISSPVS